MEIKNKAVLVGISLFVIGAAAGYLAGERSAGVGPLASLQGVSSFARLGGGSGGGSCGGYFGGYCEEWNGYGCNVDTWEVAQAYLEAYNQNPTPQNFTLYRQALEHDVWCHTHSVRVPVEG